MVSGRGSRATYEGFGQEEVEPEGLTIRGGMSRAKKAGRSQILLDFSRHVVLQEISSIVSMPLPQQRSAWWSLSKAPNSSSLSHVPHHGKLGNGGHCAPLHAAFRPSHIPRYQAAWRRRDKTWSDEDKMKGELPDSLGSLVSISAWPSLSLHVSPFPRIVNPLSCPFPSPHITTILKLPAKIVCLPFCIANSQTLLSDVELIAPAYERSVGVQRYI